MISGKEALIALANGEDVEFKSFAGDWRTLGIDELLGHLELRLKPRTITINGIVIPAPFEPKHDDECWYLTDNYSEGYGSTKHRDAFTYLLGSTWQTEEEIKQVVAVLWSIFK